MRHLERFKDSIDCEDTVLVYTDLRMIIDTILTIAGIFLTDDVFDTIEKMSNGKKITDFKSAVDGSNLHFGKWVEKIFSSFNHNLYKEFCKGPHFSSLHISGSKVKSGRGFENFSIRSHLESDLIDIEKAKALVVVHIVLEGFLFLWDEWFENELSLFINK